MEFHLIDYVYNFTSKKILYSKFFCKERFFHLVIHLMIKKNIIDEVYPYLLKNIESKLICSKSKMITLKAIITIIPKNIAKKYIKKVRTLSH